MGMELSDYSAWSTLLANGILASHELDRSFVVTDPALPDNPIVFLTPQFTAQTGYPAADALNRNCRFLQGEATDQAAIAAIRAAIGAERPIMVDLLNYRMDGTPFWNRLRIRPILLPERTQPYFVGFQNPVDQSESGKDVVYDWDWEPA